MEDKYEKLRKIRADIEKDRAKVNKLQEQIRGKMEKLREAEATQMVSEIRDLDLSPEQLGELLQMFSSGKLGTMSKRSTKSKEKADESNMEGNIESDENFSEENGKESNYE